MCIVSNLGDGFSRTWPERFPWAQTTGTSAKPLLITQPGDGPTRAEFDELKRTVEDAVKLLKLAKQYDEDHGEPDCEMDEKVEVIKRFAELVGVDLSEVFG